MTATYEKLRLSEGTVDFIMDVCRENYNLGWKHIESLFNGFENRELDIKQLDIVRSLICDANRIHRYVKGAIGYDSIVDEFRILIGMCELVG